MTKPTNRQTLLAAKRIFHDEGRIEVDMPLSLDLPKGRVSRAERNPDKGAYVLAWVWVDDDEANKEPRS